ncbi:MAG: hypothetical protein AB7I27_10340 [Bacteriovoracaceae bacterium]
MRFILFVGEGNLTEDLTKQFEALKFSCSKVSSADELLQVGKQLKKVVALFQDSKFAYRFLIENKFDDFALLNILYVSKTPVITDDVKKKLAHASLNLYYPKIKDQMLADMARFYSESVSTEKKLDIEFLSNGVEKEK